MGPGSTIEDESGTAPLNGQIEEITAQIKANQARIEQLMGVKNKQFPIKSALIEQRGKQIDSLNGCKSKKL